MIRIIYKLEVDKVSIFASGGFKVGDFIVRDVTISDIDNLIELCIPTEKREEKTFKSGKDVKRRWALKMLEKYGSFAKVAYVGSKLVGFLQYIPRPKKRIVEITCIFVPEEEYQRRGIGRSLVRAFIEDMKKPKIWFNNNPPDAVVVWAFQVPGRYPQHEFFSKMGFRRVKEDNPFLLYYPIREGYEYKETGGYIPQDEDKGKILIFYDPSCPFCIYFNEIIKREVREVAPDVPIIEFNMFEDFEEVEKRGEPPFCVVNRHAIKASFFDKKSFQNEVKMALEEI